MHLLADKPPGHIAAQRGAQGIRPATRRVLLVQSRHIRGAHRTD